jgi:hypothetical protein
MTVQVGWHRLYRLSGEWGGDVNRFPIGASEPVARISSMNRLAGNIDLLSAAGAVKISSRLSAGASLDFWRGGWHERSSLVEDPGPGGPAAFASFRVDHRLRGHNLTLGLLLTYPSWNVGLVHHAGFWSDYPVSGERHSSLAPSSSFSFVRTRFRIPRSVGVGVARRFPGRWTVAVSATHDEWTNALIDRIPGQRGPVNFFDEAPPELSVTRDTVTVSAGVEHLFVQGGVVVPVRLGVGWEPQGAMDPIARDPAGYHLLSAGAGYNTNQVKIDLAAQYRWASFGLSDVMSVESALGAAPREVVGRAASREWRIKLSAIYRLADTEKLKGILRRIFG